MNVADVGLVGECTVEKATRLGDVGDAGEIIFTVGGELGRILAGKGLGDAVPREALAMGNGTDAADLGVSDDRDGSIVGVDRGDSESIEARPDEEWDLDGVPATEEFAREREGEFRNRLREGADKRGGGTGGGDWI